MKQLSNIINQIYHRYNLTVTNRIVLNQTLLNQNYFSSESKIAFRESEIKLSNRETKVPQTPYKNPFLPKKLSEIDVTIDEETLLLLERLSLVKLNRRFVLIICLQNSSFNFLFFF